MMKRLVFSILMILALTAGAAYAQSPLNTTPPGPTQQKEPGLTNNDLPNPGNPVPTPEAQKPVQEQGTTEGTATESLNNQQGGNTTGNVTGTTTGTMDTTGTTTGTYTTGTTTTTTTTDVDTTTATGTSDLNDTGTLPSTASRLPLIGLLGLLALAAAFVVRRF